jgi:predicted ATPase
MITQLRAKNFKSWRDTGELRLAPLTGLFGTNSSGKTSLMQILLMLKQTAESPDRRRVLHTGDERSLVDLGTFFDLIHGHNPETQLELSFSWELKDSLVVNDPKKEKTPLFEISDLSFSTTIHQQKESDKVAPKTFVYRFSGKEFGLKRDEKAKDRPGIDSYELVSQGYKKKHTRGRNWPLPPPVKCYGFPDEAIGYYTNTGFLKEFELAFEELFSTIFYLGPLREHPKRSYIWAGESPVDVGRKGELAIPALLASRNFEKRSSSIGRRRKFTVEEIIAFWLKEFGLISSFSLKPIAVNRKDYEVRVKKTESSPEVLITDVGFGVSQILPVLTLCYYVPEGSIILLEQPEIHLHPFVQSALADVLIDVVNNRRIQVIVESHSEHLLRRLQRRVAEEKILPKDIALYFCEMKGSESGIKKLELDLFGNIKNWPDGFFGDEMGDLLAMTEAAMNRQGVGK